jgi:hypothetical protein
MPHAILGNGGRVCASYLSLSNSPYLTLPYHPHYYYSHPPPPASTNHWQIELLAPVRQFDFSTMTDVLFTVRYTTLDGGAVWRKQATIGALDYLKVLLEGQESGAFLMLDLKH